MLSDELSGIEKRLISTAAAVAAGCKPCTAVTIGKAREAGASEKEITRAVTIALEVKRKAYHEIQAQARKHLNSDLNASSDDVTGETTSEWLIAAGAAYAANFASGLEGYSNAAEQLGASENDFRMALQIARYVKEQAGNQVDKIAAMLTSIESIKKAGTSGCGCRPDSNGESTINSRK